MPNPNIQTIYAGEVLDNILVRVATGNQLFQKGLVHVETNIGKSLSIPRMYVTKFLQKRKEMPEGADSKGEFDIDERQLEPQDLMVYTRFNPRKFEKFWKKWQPTGNLVFSELPDNVKTSFLTALTKQVGAELGVHMINCKKGEGDEDYFDGLLTRIRADKDVVKVECASTSMIARLRAIWKGTAEDVRNDENFVILMSPADFDAYDDELTDLHHKGADPTQKNEARFKGKRVVALTGWPDGVIVGTICSVGEESNFYVGCNLADDYECVKIDRVKSDGDLYFIRMLMKADTQIAWGGLVTMLDTTEEVEEAEEEEEETDLMG